MSTADFWQFVGGIGLFLFAMSQLETALNGFAGSALRSYLRRHTDRPLKSIAVGASATAVVQSSSLVGLMVLAFVGASVISLENALGVILGANLGTTLTGWLVTTLGFKLNLDSIALPLVGVGTLILVGREGRPAEFGRMLAGIGFLLMGLSFMKDSVGAVATTVDVQRLAGLAAWQYLLFGVVFAAVVQSSSATMMLTLASLHAGVIELPAAAAVVVGADLGTTSTMLIGALKGAAGKKRVALAHVLFNVTTAVMAFALLAVLLDVIRRLGISDPLLSLVAFHSLFNAIGIVVFLPFMKPFAHFLEGRFVADVAQESLYVGETEATVSDAALSAISKETAFIISRVIRHNRLAFSPALPRPPGRPPLESGSHPHDDSRSFDEHYRRNKRLEGEILSFAIRVQGQPLAAEQSKRLNRLLSAVRHAISAAKSLRDIRHNLAELAESPRRELYAYTDYFRSVSTEFYGELYRLGSDTDAHAVVQDFAELLNRVHVGHEQMHSKIYADVQRGRLADADISSLLNVNRGILNANTSLVLALQEFCLEEGEAATLNQLSDVT